MGTNPSGRSEIFGNPNVANFAFTLLTPATAAWADCGCSNDGRAIEAVRVRWIISRRDTSSSMLIGEVLDVLVYNCVLLTVVMRLDVTEDENTIDGEEGPKAITFTVDADKTTINTNNERIMLTAVYLDV